MPSPPHHKRAPEGCEHVYKLTAPAPDQRVYYGRTRQACWARLKDHGRDQKHSDVFEWCRDRNVKIEHLSTLSKEDAVREEAELIRAAYLSGVRLLNKDIPGICRFPRTHAGWRHMCRVTGIRRAIEEYVQFATRVVVTPTRDGHLIEVSVLTAKDYSAVEFFQIRVCRQGAIQFKRECWGPSKVEPGDGLWWARRCVRKAYTLEQEELAA
jgi:hypothetical protein